MNTAFRKPVAIECDMELLDWSRLARIQWQKYGCPFDVIIIDPAWDVGLSLDYPV